MSPCLATVWTSLFPLAAEPAKKAPPGNPMMQSLLFIFVMFFILYFLMIRPQRKRQRERVEMLEALNKGDHVVTTGGIRGVITLVRDREIVVKVDDNVKLTLVKSGIARVEPPQGGEQAGS